MSQQGKKTKASLINSIFESLGKSHPEVSKDIVKVVVDEMLQNMKETLIEGNVIELRGFGIFEFRYRKAKEHARNPKTGKKISVPGHAIVAFKSGKEIKEAIWDEEYGKKD